MSYEPTNWKAGDTVTSVKLNKLEQGVAAAGGESILFVNMTLDNNVFTLDTTAGEIYEAFRNGNVKFILRPEEGGEVIINLLLCQITLTGYVFSLTYGLSVYAATANDYPTSVEPTNINAN